MRILRAAMLALAALLLLIAAAVPAGAQPVAWIATGWNVHLLYQADPSVTSHFFNTPASYGTGPHPATGPVEDGFATTPVLVYDSYAQFAADLADGAITYPYATVMYDPEEWAATPLDEQQDPGTYLAAFAQLAHAHGYRVIETPARDLGNVDTTCPKKGSQTLDQWYIACGIPGLAAADSDVVVIQSQVDTTSLGAFDSLVAAGQAQALAANPSVQVLAEVSTSYGTAAQMSAAAQSVTTGGYYVSISEPQLTQADTFFQDMQAAGY